MPYDPNFPPHGADLFSAEFRAQFNGLKDIDDALAASTITAVVVDSVTTLDPGQPATVGVSVTGNTLHLAFSIPRGSDGSSGTNGGNGGDGGPGPQGSPFASAVVGSVSTLNPGEAATVGATFDGTTVHLTFGIPRGADGIPGEVSNAALAGAIAGTSNNTNAVTTLDTPFINDPPTLADMEVMRAAHNALVLALKR